MSALPKKRCTQAVVTVGEGRGFVVNGLRNRLIVTAAHCLPSFPPCHGASYIEERTFGSLLAPIGREPSVCAECLFADPVADIAVLGSPDSTMDLSDEADAYEALVEAATPLSIADAPEEGHGWVLSLDGKWFRCTVKYMKRRDGPLLVSDAAQPIVRGMSGSPIVSDNGSAIGIVCLGSNRYGCNNPRLLRDLPGWLLNAQRLTG
jgi:hypothetical protein